MLLSTHERFFLHCELNLGTFRNQGLPLKLVAEGDEADVVTVLEKAWKANKAKVQLGIKDIVRITEIKRYPKDDMIVLLFRRGDPNAAAQIYEDKEGNLRRSDKGDEDQVTVSCHLFIHTKPTGDRRYKAILEEVPSLGRSYVQQIFSSILSRFKYTWANAKNVEKETYTNARLDGLKGEKLGDGRGTFEYIELYREAHPDGLDMPSIEPKQEIMKLKIKAGTANVIDKIMEVKDWALGKNWTDIRVRVNMPEGRSRIVQIGREADAADVLFVRSVPVSVKNSLEVCTSVVVDELRLHAKEQFARADWK